MLMELVDEEILELKVDGWMQAVDLKSTRFMSAGHSSAVRVVEVVGGGLW